MFIRSAFNYDGDVVSHKGSVDCSGDPTRAQQHMKDECDINFMVERFSRTGEIPVPPVVPAQVDYDDVFDFQSAMNVVIAGERAFDSLPAKIRKEFDNDPGRFLQFLSKDENYDEAVRLGVLEPKKEASVPEPQRVIVVDQVPAPAKPAPGTGG